MARLTPRTATTRLDYRTLADLRYQIRRFLRVREVAARAAGVEPQQYLVLLQIKGLQGHDAATMSVLAERLQIRHHGVVQLVDRLVRGGMVERRRDGRDRREVVVRLRPAGERVLKRLASYSLAELTSEGPSLVASLNRLVLQSTRGKMPSRNGTGKVAGLNRHGLATVVLLAPALMVGCAKTPATMTTSAPAPTGAAVVSPMTGGSTSSQPAAPSDTERSMSQGGASTVAGARPAPSEFGAVRDLTDIHFDFDKYAIRPEDAQILDANARWLNANPKDLLLIEGHCDERGTEEYNLALGDRRAKAAMNYLAARGIAPARMTIISYGKEHPQCAEHNEACWAKNRRSHFLVKRG